MIRFERTVDYDLVRAILTHPRIWPMVSDGSIEAEDFTPNDHPGIIYLLAYDDELLGMFAFHPQNAVCYEIHTAMLPHAWGERAAAAGRHVWAWMWAHSPARRIVASAPACNRLVIRYAERSGMKRYGVNESSFPRSGKLYDQVLFGISPE